MILKIHFVLISFFLYFFCFSQKDGKLDKSFGDKGIVITDLYHDNDYCKSMAIQKDGKIILAGFTDNGTNEDFALCRFHPDGALDTLFGTKGKIITPVGHDYDLAYAVKIQSSGKIIAAGYTGDEKHEDFVLVRYNSDGKIDSSFGNKGIVITSIGKISDNLFALEVLPDDKIIAAGNTNNGTMSGFVLVKYQQNGQTDMQFGTDGIVITYFDNAEATADALVLQKDGKIILGGSVRKNIYSDFALVRYLPNGLTDTTFGKNGTVLTSISKNNDNVTSLLIQPDGKIIAGGNTFFNNKNDFAAVRYLPDGAVDTTFGNKGIVINDEDGANEFSSISLLQEDGKILLIGNTTSDSITNIKIIRYTSRGKPDKTFGKRGKTTTKIANGYRFHYAFAGAIQADGKILVSGNSRLGNFTDLTLLRYKCRKKTK